MRLLHMPGVHRPVSDTWLLADALCREEVGGRSVADLCAGCGALSIVAAQEGAGRVLAVDVSRRATLATRMNARLNGCAVQVKHGDLIDALEGERFDVIVCNPPYVPSETDALPRHSRRTALDGGRDGRIVIDRVCRHAPRHLRPGGTLLLVHSSVCGAGRTNELLESLGVQAEVVARSRGELGPVLRARAPMLRSRGLLGEGDEEEIVVVRGRTAAPDRARREVGCAT